jgi:hypothetical protein
VDISEDPEVLRSIREILLLSFLRHLSLKNKRKHVENVKCGKCHWVYYSGSLLQPSCKGKMLMNSQEIMNFMAQAATSRSDSENFWKILQNWKFMKLHGPEKRETCVIKDTVEIANEESSVKTSSTVPAFNSTHNSCI